VTDLPPWHARNEREKQQMKDWLFRELNQMQTEEIELAAQKTKISISVQLAIVRAYGKGAADAKMKPLRDLYPHLAPFLHPPKGTRGKYFRPRDKAKGKAERAAQDVRRIRAIWKKHYGRQNRGRDDISAVEIAAEFWEISPDEVAVALDHPK
jgi:hypothetical protein